MATRLREIMTRQPNTLDANATVQQAAQLMAAEGIGDVIVCQDQRACGIVTDRDIAVRVVAAGNDPETTTLGEIASDDLLVLTPAHTVEDAVIVMRDRAIRRLPIVDGSTAVGVVSLGDLAMRGDPESVLADISAAPPNM